MSILGDSIPFLNALGRTRRKRGGLVAKQFEALGGCVMKKTVVVSDPYPTIHEGFVCGTPPHSNSNLILF
jgi:hypothetical protein